MCRCYKQLIKAPTLKSCESSDMKDLIFTTSYKSKLVDASYEFPFFRYDKTNLGTENTATFIHKNGNVVSLKLIFRFNEQNCTYCWHVVKEIILKFALGVR